MKLDEDGVKTAPAQVRRISGAVVELTIHEGRNRQVKRMFEAVGHRVKRLHRSRYGSSTSKGSSPAHGASSSPPKSKSCAGYEAAASA